MSLRNMVIDHNSEDVFKERLLNVLASGAGLVHVRSAEVMRTVRAIRQTIVMESHEYVEWDVSRGSRKLTHETIYQHDTESDAVSQIVPALKAVWDKYLWWKKDATEDEKGIDYVFTFVNPQHWLGQNPAAAHYLLEMAYYLPESSVRVVFVTDDKALPDAVRENFVNIEFDLPGHGELLERLEANIEDYGDPEAITITEDQMDEIAVAGAGMTIPDFDVAVASSIVDTLYADTDGDEAPVVEMHNVLAGVSKAKTEAIKKSEALELLQAGNMEDVGGLDILKEWIKQREHTYSDEFLDFGGEPPKGIVVVGVPGTGKSLIAKAVGNQLGIPIVRFDFGAVFNALVGSSEERIRKALKLVEAMSPCVLFVDEIDKGLGGLGGSGDSGTSMRVFGTFLTWLQDCDKPVFTMVTANNIMGLPPELMRRGRFDQIFSTTLPNEYEREDVLAIHLRKRGHDIDQFSAEDIDKFLEASDECVAAEIESLVKDAIVLAFNDNPEEPELHMDHILRAREQMVPLSKSHADGIQRIVDWAKDNAQPASYTKKEMSEMRPSRASKKPATAPRKVRGGKSEAKTASVTKIDTKRTRTRKKKDEE